MAMGIGLYFSLLHEPPFFYGLFCLCVSVFFVFKSTYRFRTVSILAFCVCLGFFSAQVRTNVVYTPILSKSMPFKNIEGRIDLIEDLEKGGRVVLSNVVIEGLKPEDTPKKIRLKLWNIDGLFVDYQIKGLASLNPPSPPVIPKGFDFQRLMYFRGIGGVGFLYGAPDIISHNDVFDIRRAVEKLRFQIGARIDHALNTPEASLAKALMIGQKSSISTEDMEAIRAVGLAHMLAISGLHLGLFSGFVFFVLRLGMAAFEGFALRHPVKKYAAIGAIIAAFFYMWIAGATIPTQRAMISVAVIFTAILLDRSAISLRVVAFGAFCILLFLPESLTSVSFQMSFAAVTALVAFYECTRPLWINWNRQSGVFRKLCLYVGGVCATTIIATLATAPLTLFHFQTLPVYGLLANVLCVPLLSFIIMPLLIFAFVFMPLGLDTFILSFLELPLSLILELSHWIAEFDKAVFTLGAFDFAVLVFFILASLSLILLKGHMRVFFASMFIVLCIFNFHFLQYDMLVSSKVDLVAFRSSEPQMHISDARKSRFERQKWVEGFGFDENLVVSFPREGVQKSKDHELVCDYHACRLIIKGHQVSVIRGYEPAVYQTECEWAQIVILKQYIKGRCSADHRLHIFNARKHGVHAFIFKDNAVNIERIADFRGQRPWVSEKY
ncbi:MAG: ComEC/Rec2 family competence protein [Bdellovibrionales bacterium]